uniref:Uncharacterized protein n=1 Tax=Arundo donax TaxID=35708 RepID=A0A0A9GRK5_ARUDO
MPVKPDPLPLLGIKEKQNESQTALCSRQWVSDDVELSQHWAMDGSSE